jgi:hypothetical protein
MVKLSPRQQGQAAPRTLRLTMCAILGAVWEDCRDKATIDLAFSKLL